MNSVSSMSSTVYATIEIGVTHTGTVMARPLSPGEAAAAVERHAMPTTLTPPVLASPAPLLLSQTARLCERLHVHELRILRAGAWRARGSSARDSQKGAILMGILYQAEDPAVLGHMAVHPVRAHGVQRAGRVKLWPASRCSRWCRSCSPCSCGPPRPRRATPTARARGSTG